MYTPFLTVSALDLSLRSLFDIFFFFSIHDWDVHCCRSTRTIQFWVFLLFSPTLGEWANESVQGVFFFFNFLNCHFVLCVIKMSQNCTVTKYISIYFIFSLALSLDIWLHPLPISLSSIRLRFRSLFSLSLSCFLHWLILCVCVFDSIEFFTDDNSLCSN